MTHCRIGKVTIKPVPRIVPKEPMKHALMNAAKSIASQCPEKNMGGYFICTWQADGTYWTGWEFTEKSVVANALGPSFVAEAFRRDLVNRGW